jgi:hypothetical protein
MKNKTLLSMAHFFIVLQRNCMFYFTIFNPVSSENFCIPEKNIILQLKCLMFHSVHLTFNLPSILYSLKLVSLLICINSKYTSNITAHNFCRKLLSRLPNITVFTVGEFICGSQFGNHCFK